MKQYILERNEYLRRRLYGRSNFHYDNSTSFTSSTSSTEQRVTEAILTLKNNYNKTDLPTLTRAKNFIRAIAQNGIREIIAQQSLPVSNVTVVCVPRSKANFVSNQLFFRQGISEAVNLIPGIHNGTDFIKRVTNTKTTHLRNTKKGDLGTDGPEPYPGITNDTCILQGDVQGKVVILVDDIYTKDVNIDEDCCQFLLDRGARAVILYTICKTGYN